MKPPLLSEPSALSAVHEILRDSDLRPGEPLEAKFFEMLEDADSLEEFEAILDHHTDPPLDNRLLFYLSGSQNARCRIAMWLLEMTRELRYEDLNRLDRANLAKFKRSFSLAVDYWVGRVMPAAGP